VAGIVIVALVVWALLPATAPEQSAVEGSGEVPVIVEAAAGPGEGLIEDFLGQNDWGDDEIARFRTAWEALSNLERSEAQATSAFEQLSTAIREEVNAQQALTDLDETGMAREVGQRVYDFGKYLGLEHTLPKVDFSEPPPESASAPQGSVVSPAGAVDDGSAAGAQALLAGLGETLSELSQPAETQSASAALQAAATSQASGASDISADWLEAQDVNAYTLQLFAMSSQENVEKALAGYPGLDLHSVELSTATPKYRILHGSYATQAAARAAHGSLPGDLADKPLVVKSIPDLRAARAGASVTTAASLDAHRAWIEAQRRDHFTLQLFAMNIDANVERLISTHPDLNLKVHLSNDTRSRFRIIYGAFATEQKATEAFGSLPQTIRREAGSPVVKQFSELRATAVAAAP